VDYSGIYHTGCSGISFGVKLKDFGYDVEPLSFTSIYATTNGITAVLLIAGVISIKMVA
jgi:putative membrane protein